MKMRSC